ncbi:predicted protein [Nematostella vectensis]|uniref:G-protein coupled receptors family 1 profile domain-containing protein n=1 Tax=Nematostella vectensis TaxID=45351 RepID=A7RXP9_NEMVE|nr:trace amine-associated receptor 1 [Nematostella vectensis]EDO43816.1 predicted protein [Nematostella vectensis]|eukprot:XP_001635879.1 predicted protein [Nematostella vectensis]
MKINVTTIKLLISSAQEKSGPLEISIRLSILVLLFFTTVLGNGSILVMLKRFKSLRTIPNILIANLAFIDLMNGVINLPLVAMLTNVHFQRHVKGRLTSAIVACLQSAFVLLNLFGMMFMMLDRYSVIKWGMKYKVWSGTDKAFKAVLITWLLTVAIMVPWFLSLYDVDLGDAPTVIYRMVYYYKIGNSMTVIRSVFSAIFALMALMTWYSIKKQIRINEKKLSLHHHFHGLQQRETRRRIEAHAATTVGLTVGSYVLSCIPLIMYGVLSQKASDLVSSNFLKWFGDIANYFQFVSSMCNPFIYMARCKRFNQALKLLCKDPLGTSEPRENASYNKRPLSTSACSSIQYSNKSFTSNERSLSKSASSSIQYSNKSFTSNERPLSTSASSSIQHLNKSLTNCDQDNVCCPHQDEVRTLVFRVIRVALEDIMKHYEEDENEADGSGQSNNLGFTGDDGVGNVDKDDDKDGAPSPSPP